MFETAFALGLTQFARSLSFPERLSHRPARNTALEPWRLRNTGLDALYYDVKALTAEEAFYVSDCLAAAGMIMIVPPTGHGMLTLCESVEEFRLRGGLDVHAMAVAGMGGSAIGAAAFARNVADSLGAPVAAVVSGYGLGDIVNEAIGGAFLFGWMGHVRSNLEAIDDAVGRPKVGAYNRREIEPPTTARRTGLDSDTVLSLLEDAQLNFTFIAGHSRGNRVIADALYALKRSNADQLAALASTCRIVTFGGRIKMPEAFGDVIDVVGELDWFGELNSRPKIPTDVKVPFCGHSTNTDIPGALQVKKILTGILADTRPEPAINKEVPREDEARLPSPAQTEPVVMDALARDTPAPVELASTDLVAEPIAAEIPAISEATDQASLEAVGQAEHATTPMSANETETIASDSTPEALREDQGQTMFSAIEHESDNTLADPVAAAGPSSSSTVRPTASAARPGSKPIRRRR